jgi:uncharacterized protein
MFDFSTPLASAWINRKNFDTSARRAARERVADLSPAVVITGASRGIGLALAQVFHAAGHTVVLIARNETELMTAAQSFEPSATARVLTLALDVTAPNAESQLDDGLARAGCYLDTLVNNAAIGVSGRFDQNPLQDIDNLVAINVAALTRLTRHALPGMIARGSGGILNIASLGGAVPGPYQAAYYASKAYVMSLTEALASEAGGLGVRISLVAPGPVATSFHENMGADRALYRILLPECSPARVAAIAYRGFQLGQRLIVPGITNRFFYLALRLLPHPISVTLTGWLLRNPK